METVVHVKLDAALLKARQSFSTSHRVDVGLWVLSHRERSAFWKILFLSAGYGADAISPQAMSQSSHGASSNKPFKDAKSA